MLKIFRFPHLFLSLIFISYLLFGFYHLSQFITADEHYWIYERIPKYWNALTEGEWARTLINDKPGVSLALVSGLGLLYDTDPSTLCLENNAHVTICNNERAETLLFFFRLPLILVNFVLLLYLFFVIKRLAGETVALFSVLFMALSPILLGMTQIINPDTLLWSFGAAALFSYLALLQFREKKYLFLTGFFLALSVLSKYTASFLVPFFFALSLLQPFFASGKSNQESFSKVSKGNLLFFFGSLCFAVLIGALLLPAAWSNPLVLLKLFWGGGAVPFPLYLLLLFGIFVLDSLFFRSRLSFTFKLFFERIHFLPFLQRLLPLLLLLSFLILLLGRFFFPEWSLFEKVMFDLKDLYSNDKPDAAFLPNFWQSYLLELNPLVLSLTPIALFFFLFLLITQTLEKTTKNAETTKKNFFSFSLVFFIFSFIFAIIFSEVLATARYLILLYPIVAFLAALGGEKFIHTLFSIFKNMPWGKNLSWGVFLLAFAFSLLSLTLSAPFYFNYTNSFLPKEKLIHHAWGYGGYEAAQFLNALPNAEKLTVWSDYHGVCEFFVGRCVTMEYASARTQNIDYVVVSARGKTLYKPEHVRWQKPGNLYAKPAYDNPAPLWQLIIHDRPENYIKVDKYEKR